MSHGLFEPLYGKKSKEDARAASLRNNPTKQIQPSQPQAQPQAQAQAQLPQPPQLGVPDFGIINKQFGDLIGQLDKAKVQTIVLLLAVAILLAFIFYLNSRQKQQKFLIYKMQKQLKRLRG